MPKRPQLLLISLSLMLGCSGQSGGEFAGPGGPVAGSDGLATVCASVSQRELALSQAAPIGFSGQDMLTLAGGTSTINLSYRDQTSTSLMLRIEERGDSATFVERENQGSSASTDCASQLQVPITLQFSTSDGAFAESREATLTATQSTAAGVFLALPLAELMGSFAFDQFDAASYQQRSVLIDALFTAQGPRGRVQTLGRNDSNHPDDPGTRISEVGQWPGEGS